MRKNPFPKSKAFLISENREKQPSFDFSHRNADCEDLSNLDLRHVNFEGASLRESNLNYANLEGVNLVDTDLAYASFEGANLVGANLSRSFLDGTSFKNANLTNSNFSDIENLLQVADFNGAKLEGIITNNLEFAQSEPQPIFEMDFISSLIEPYNLSTQDISDKIKLFRRHKSGLGTRLVSLSETLSSQGLPYSRELYQLLKDMSDQLKGTILESKVINLTSYGQQMDPDASDVHDFLRHLTPFGLFEFSVYNSKITTQSFPHLELRIMPGSRDVKSVDPKLISILFFGLNILNKLTDITNLYINVKIMKKDYGRDAAYDPMGGGIGMVVLDPNATSINVLHETLHALEFIQPNVNHLVTSFFASRVQKEDYKVLHQAKGYGTEYAFRGVFFDDYAGKLYPKASEFISTSMQEYITPQRLFRLARKDYAHFLFTYSIITGQMRKYL